MMAYFRPLALALLALAYLFPPEGAFAQSTRVTFLLVNDIYLMGDEVMADGQRRGGFPRLAAVVKAERAKGSHVLLAHAGDTLSPSLTSGLDQGAGMMALTNRIAPDIFVPGNHEFDFGKAIFLRRMAEASFPLYCANLRGPDAMPLPGFKDRAILTFEGVRIGLTGATFDGTPRSSSPEDLKFLPTVETIKEQGASLRNEGADFVVAVVHADRRQDYAIMESGAVNILLSGHDHDLFINFNEQVAGVESSYDAHYVVAIDLTIDVKEEQGRRVTTWWPQFRVIDTASVTLDPEMAQIVAGYERDFSGEMDAPLATTAIRLDSSEALVRTRETSIGDIIADAMRTTLHADAALMNGGGIRGNKIYPVGTTISRRDVINELPFGNRAVAVEIDGRGLRQAIENGLSLLPAAAGRFPQVAGLTIEADLSRPAGMRVLSIKVGDQPLEDAKTYRVAINDFMGRGGDGYTVFREAPHLLPDTDSPLLAEVVSNYIRTAGTITAPTGGRIVFK
jgi:2',3'-cyclic-nucleotide 2'-phosphodiesterase (5'-nucleotidase family)